MVHTYRDATGTNIFAIVMCVNVTMIHKIVQLKKDYVLQLELLHKDTLKHRNH